MPPEREATRLGTCPKHREGRIHWDETVNEYRCAECGYPLIGPPPNREENTMSEETRNEPDGLLYLVRCGHCGHTGTPEDGACAKCGRETDPADEPLHAQVVPGPSERFLYSAEILVRVTPEGETEIIGPGMSEPLILRPGDRIKFKPTMSLETTTDTRMDRWKEHLGDEFGGRSPKEYAAMAQEEPPRV